MITPASDRLYSILRQLCDPTYKSPDPPTEQEMMEAVIAYEEERKMTTVCPSPNLHRELEYDTRS